MNAPIGSAAPASGTSTGEDGPTFETLAADPEIAALLDFDPVPRKLRKADGWTPAMQRMFIAWLAHYGTAGKAARELDKARSGIDKVYQTPDADSFRAAWDGAIALAERRLAERIAAGPGAGTLQPPFARVRRGAGPAAPLGPPPGQMMNEFGEWEDEDSLMRRAEEARDSISNKLRRARRLYLREISECAGKRAAFEILTELPVDWDKAERLEPQLEEPWRRVSLRQPDMLLMAEAGWIGDMTHGRNRIVERMAELREAMDEYHAEHGLPPIDWDNETFDDPEHRD